MLAEALSSVAAGGGVGRRWGGAVRGQPGAPAPVGHGGVAPGRPRSCWPGGWARERAAPCWTTIRPPGWSDLYEVRRPLYEAVAEVVIDVDDV